VAIANVLSHKFNFSVNDIVETLTVIIPFDIVVEFSGM